jgi:hypothetical protein
MLLNNDAYKVEILLLYHALRYKHNQLKYGSIIDILAIDIHKVRLMATKTLDYFRINNETMK